eukprot:jgi/Orpsp1_1/1182905/evm.model.c7180000083128.1
MLTLVKKNEELVNIVDNNGENALFHALGKSIETFEYLLNNTKIDVNLRNNDKENVLFISCRNGLSQYVEKLVEISDIDYNFLIIIGFLDKLYSYSIRHANFNHQDDLGNSTLHYAVKLKSKYDVNLLALNHADPNLTNKQDQFPMDLAKQMEEDDLIKIMKKTKT